MRVKGGLEAAHLGDAGNQFGARVCWKPAGSGRYKLLAPEAGALLQGRRGEGKRCVAARGCGLRLRRENRMSELHNTKPATQARKILLVEDNPFKTVWELMLAVHGCGGKFHSGE